MKPVTAEHKPVHPVWLVQQPIIDLRQLIRNFCEISGLPKRRGNLRKMRHSTPPPNSAA
jgi:hypothetical protein